jgi:hypothetical protein
MSNIASIGVHQNGHGKPPVKGYRSTLISDESFAYLKALQAGFPEPWLDLKYISDAVVQLLRALPQDTVQRELLTRARESMRDHLELLNQSTS